VSRGQLVERAGVVGRWVGLSSTGLEWVAYQDADFATMCQAFDQAEARRIARGR
jgi:hypothetical protein